MNANATTVTKLLITGFHHVQHFRIPLFILFLLIYIVSCLENIVIIALVYTSPCLHSPMFFIVSNLSFCYMLHITNLVPRMLFDILSEKPTIAIINCIVQVNILATTGITICALYALMSYDRYLAISNPLRYSTIINNWICLWVVVGYWIVSFACSTTISILLSQLHFCSSNIIDNFHCDLSPLVELSCSDSHLVLGVGGLISGLALMLPFLFDIGTYVFIIIIILKIPTTTGRSKSFSTCSSHLLVVTINYGALIIIYVLPTKQLPNLNKGLSFIHFMFIPLMNPIIYTLRNQVFQKSFESKVNEVRMFFNLK